MHSRKNFLVVVNSNFKIESGDLHFEATKRSYRRLRSRKSERLLALIKSYDEFLDWIGFGCPPLRAVLLRYGGSPAGSISQAAANIHRRLVVIKNHTYPEQTPTGEDGCAVNQGTDSEL